MFLLTLRNFNIPTFQNLWVSGVQHFETSNFQVFIFLYFRNFERLKFICVELGAFPNSHTCQLKLFCIYSHHTYKWCDQHPAYVCVLFLSMCDQTNNTHVSTNCNWPTWRCCFLNINFINLNFWCTKNKKMIYLFWCNFLQFSAFHKWLCWSIFFLF